MASKTDFLNLVLPGNDEYTDTWDQIVNANMNEIDLWAAAIQQEIEGSRGSFSSLGDFLAVGHNSDGTNKPSDEVAFARNSKLYGDQLSNNDPAMLYDHFEFIDFETYYARNGLASVQDSLATMMAGFAYPNTAIKGPATGDGYPNFMTTAGADFQLTGSVSQPIVLNVGGYYLRVRKNTSTTASGAVGTKYLVATKPTTPTVVLDRSTQSAGALTTNPDNESKLQILQDAGIDFTQTVVAGDMLEILNSNGIGKYVVASVAPGGNVNRIVIKGIFKGTGSGINYKVYDPFAPALAIETTFTPAENKCIIGQGYWDGVGLINSVTFAFQGRYESTWRSVDATAGGGFYGITFDHNLGFIPRRIIVLASQVNDDTGFVEPLSTAEVDNQLAVSINNSLTYTPATAQLIDGNGDDTLIFTGGSLGGSVTGGLSGTIRNSRSARVKASRTQIMVKNPTQNLFYIDFDGTVKTSGYIKVICER